MFSEGSRYLLVTGQYSKEGEMMNIQCSTLKYSTVQYSSNLAADRPWSPLCPLTAVHLDLSRILASRLEIINPIPQVGHHEALGLDHPLLGLHRLLELLVLLGDRATLPSLLGHVLLLGPQLGLHLPPRQADERPLVQTRPPQFGGLPLEGLSLWYEMVY